jgi:creatinine amidohydrolase
MKTVKTEDMNWVDIKEKIDRGYKTILIAVGSIEQHGPHLPIKTDAKIGDALVTKIVEIMPKEL